MAGKITAFVLDVVKQFKAEVPFSKSTVQIHISQNVAHCQQLQCVYGHYFVGVLSKCKPYL